MKKHIICTIFALLSSATAFSADNQSTKMPGYESRRQELFLQKTGGIIVKEGSGKILLANTQSKIPDKDIQKVMEEFRHVLKMPMELRQSEWRFGDKFPDDASVAVYIINDDSMPMSLVAMEDRWGLINVSELDSTRFGKELARVMIATLGSGASQYKASYMQPVHAPADLDTIIKPALTVDAIMSMKFNLEKLGVTPSRSTAYRKACMEGWAPVPTNDYQRAIWDETHALPANPMKIEFDPKKGR